MLDSCLYNNLNHILPKTCKSKHGIPRLEYICAINIMDNEKNILKILQLLPARLYKSLLQSVIHNSYAEFIKSFNICNSWIELDNLFPETLGTLVLNWPYAELILRNQIPSLDPPVDIFQGVYSESTSQTHTFGQVHDMLSCFNTFCGRLINFIIQAVFKCTQSTNTQSVSYNLRKLDVSGLINKDGFRTLVSYKILDGIRNSKIDKFGQKIEIFAEAKAVLISDGRQEYELLRNIIEQNLKSDTGISVNFKTITIDTLPGAPLPDDFYDVLARSRCEYIQLHGFIIDKNLADNLCMHLPGLLGLSLIYPWRIKTLECLSSFQYLEQLCIGDCNINGLTNAICNISKGLKYLKLEKCSLKRQDFECLATSINSETLLQLDISGNDIGENDFEAVGLTTLCQNLKNVKVFIVERCHLEFLSSNKVTQLVNAIKDCNTLEFLSMKYNSFNLEISTIIIDSLAQNNSLRYLSLDLPEMPRTRRMINVDENMVYRQNLCKTFHEKVNEFRHSPLYISWN